MAPEGRRFVKANDGITLDIYEGETFGLSVKPAAAKSTLGRTILQLYHQTYGRTMYYGRSLTIWRPEVRHRHRQESEVAPPEAPQQLEERRDKLEAQYAQLSEAVYHARRAGRGRKLAEDALLDITKIVGGFLVVDDLNPVIAIYSKGLCRRASSRAG